MKDQDKTKEQLIQELAELRQRVAELEAADTERKWAEEALRESEERFQQVAEHAQEWIWEVDAHGSYTYSSPIVEEILGYKPEEVVGKKHFYDLFHPEDREELKKAAFEVFAQKQSFREFINRNMRKDGETVWLSTSGVTILDEEGNLLGYRGADIDTTERKQAQEALRESEERLKILFEFAPDGYYVNNLKGTFIDGNKAAEEITGYKREELMGKSFLKLKLLPPNQIPRAAALLVQNALGKPTGPDEFTLNQKDGSQVPVEIRTFPIKVKGQTLVLGIARDITERKRAEEELRRSLEETARGQRMLLALSQAAQTVQRAHTPEEVYRIVGDEVSGLGYHVAVFSLTADRAHLAMSHLSFEPALLQAAENLSGLSAQDFRFAIVPGGIHDQIISEGRSIFLEPVFESMAEALPKLAHPLIGRIAAMLGLEQAVYAPLRVGGETHGSLIVTGTGLTEADMPAVTAFANQTAIALDSARAEEELRQSYVKLRRTLEETVNTLVSAIEMRDPYTGSHQRRVTQLACAIANEMGLPEEQIEGVHMAGLIHDLGKITVPAEILSKPSRLAELEFGLIKMHPQVGYDVLKEMDFPWPVAQMVLQHHERMDGSGYPQGLSGEEIILETRILGVADVVEAMASHRPYRSARGIDKALEEISQNKGLLYDPEVVVACVTAPTEKGFTFDATPSPPDFAKLA